MKSYQQTACEGKADGATMKAMTFPCRQYCPNLVQDIVTQAKFLQFGELLTEQLLHSDCAYLATL